jgi:hypothetical protein
MFTHNVVAGKKVVDIPVRLYFVLLYQKRTVDFD